MVLPVKFLARPAHNPRNGHHHSLRVIYPTSRLPGDGSLEFGRIRREQNGWNAFSSDEDFDRALKAACYRVGKDAAITVLLAEIRNVYMGWHHETDIATEDAYNVWVASMGDPSGRGQDWDANHRI